MTADFEIIEPGLISAKNGLEDPPLPCEIKAENMPINRGYIVAIALAAGVLLGLLSVTTSAYVSLWLWQLLDYWGLANGNATRVIVRVYFIGALAMFPSALLVMAPIGYLGKMLSVKVAFLIGGVAAILIFGMAFYDDIRVTLASSIEAVVLIPFAACGFLLGRMQRARSS